MELIFYKAKGDWLDWGIRWKTWGPYSHCELRLEQHLTFSSSWRDGGVRFRDMVINSRSWDRLILDVDAEQSEKILKWCAKQHGKYDLWGIFGFMIGQGVQHTEQWYCSEICAAALNRYVDTSLPEHISPNKLYRYCVQQPGLFRPPADPAQPFVPTLPKSYLEPARELVRDILELPTHMETIQMSQLMMHDPVMYAVVRSLIRDYQGWG